MRIHIGLFISFLLFFIPTHLIGAEGKPVIKQHISITFDIENRVLFGTSHITIPAEKELTLYFGSLRITGNVLEEKNKTPQIIRLTNNKIFLPSTSNQKQLSISWELKTKDIKSAGNIINHEGISLTGLWHPQTDTDMLFSLEAVLPHHFSCITESDQISTKPLASQPLVKTTSSFSQPMPSIHFIAGPYVVSHKRLGDIDIYGYFFEEDKELAKGYLEKTAEYIARYEALLGPFPYPRYSVVENRRPTGYAIPSFTLLGQSVIRLPFIKDTSLGHEVVHAWLGNAVSTIPEGG